MIKRSISINTICSLLFLSISLFVKGGESDSWFNQNDLTLTGVYYYPEQWDENQWERDLKQIGELGFEFTHFGEFAWAQLEPEEGKYNFEWLDRAISIAAKCNLKVILCTTTAAPPVWLSRKHPEILLRAENGDRADHGARQHASFASAVYKKYADKMTEQLARRYGNDIRVIGWQIDNEPKVQFDYSPEAESAFRDFLKRKYENDIQQLNAAWGTAFWSQPYSFFDEINLPKMQHKLANPHQIQDYRYFAAKQTTDFINEQCNIIRKHSKNQWVTSNYVPDYKAGHIGNSKQLDFPSYTCYMVAGGTRGFGRRGFRLGNYLQIPFANDFFRPINQTYGVMEIQPGQVNWGNINPQPAPGAVRLWLWSIFAGGSDFICTYRYRQPLSGFEQYHCGIMDTDGVTLKQGGHEFVRFIEEIKALRKEFSTSKDLQKKDNKLHAAILFNHENAWSIDRQKQHTAWNTMWHIEKYYQILKSFGYKVDLIDETKDFNQYPMLLIPAYEMVDEKLISRWDRYIENGGNLIVTCRTAYKNRMGHFPETPFRSLMDSLSGNSMLFFDLLLPQALGTVKMDNKEYTWKNWGEVLEPFPVTEKWAVYSDEFYEGKAAATFRKKETGSVAYIGVDSDNGDFERDILKKLHNALSTPVLNLPYGIILEHRDGFGIVLNYRDTPYEFDLPSGANVIIGNKEIPAGEVLVFRINE